MPDNANPVLTDQSTIQGLIGDGSGGCLWVKLNAPGVTRVEVTIPVSMIVRSIYFANVGNALVISRNQAYTQQGLQNALTGTIYRDILFENDGTLSTNFWVGDLHFPIMFGEKLYFATNSVNNGSVQLHFVNFVT